MEYGGVSIRGECYFSVFDPKPSPTTNVAAVKQTGEIGGTPLNWAADWFKS